MMQSAKQPRDRLARVKARPDPKQWDDQEAMTLAEAVALFFPDGPLSLSSLRRAAAAGQLATTRVAGKDLTTKHAVREMLRPSKAARRSRPTTSSEGRAVALGTGSSATGAGISAQAAASKTLKALRIRSKGPALGPPVR